MPKPRTFHHVEWTIARWPDQPNDRLTRSRNFVRAEYAAAQVIALSTPYSRDVLHAEVVGVWVTAGWDDGLVWEEVDPDTLPINPDDAARYTTIINSQEELL